MKKTIYAIYALLFVNSMSIGQTPILSLDASKGFNATTWQDQSGNGNHVSLASTSKTADGVYFDGNNSAMLTSPIPFSNFTVYMTVKVQEMGKTLLGNGQPSEYGLHYQDNALFTATDQPFSVFNSSALKLNKNMVIALSRDVSKSGGNVTLYIDGVLVGTFPAAHKKIFNLVNLTGENGFLFKGWIQRVSVYTAVHDLARIKNENNRPTTTVRVDPNKVSNGAVVSLPLVLPFSDRIKLYKVQKKGNNFILNGDIIVSKRSINLEGISNPFDKIGTRIVGKTDTWFEGFKWKNGEIPVVIDNSIFAMGIQNTVFDALEELNNSTVLCFRPKKDNDGDYVRIIFDSDLGFVGGSSYVGRDGGEQDLKLNLPINSGKFVIVHELLHAAGFYHEQSREDRDNYVRIIEDNIQDDRENNFEKEEESNSPYDYCSIMHYSPMTFSKNNKPTIECLTNGRTVPCPSCMGAQTSISALDIKGIQSFYGINRFPCGVKWKETKSPLSYSIANNNYNYLTGDFNGDGKTDLFHIVNNDYSHTWLSRGDGTFDIKSRFPAQNGYLMKNEANYKFLTGDFNGDGKTDILHIVNSSYLHVWISKGDGTFEIKTRFPAQDGYVMNNAAGYHFTVGDFNGDGKSDLFHVVNNDYSHVLLSKGDGTFDLKARFPAQNGYAMKNDANYKFLPGDFNGDGKTDMVHVVNGNYLHIWISKGDGSFEIKGRFPAQNGYVLNNAAGYNFTVGDFNGDGKSDLFHIINGDYSHTWLSNGDGTFDIKARFPAQNGYVMKNEAGFKFLAGDFNGDGKTDLMHIVNNDYAHTWISKGDGNYEIKPRFPAQNGYALKNDGNFKFLVGKFDGDGKMDMMHMVNDRFTHLWRSLGDGTFQISKPFPE
jgi:phage gp16-like protein